MFENQTSGWNLVGDQGLMEAQAYFNRHAVIVGAVESALLREITAYKERLSTGIVSNPYLLDVILVLDAELCWRLTTTREFPSWHGIAIGSDNDLLKEPSSGGSAIMPSLGGGFARWCYRGLVGIGPYASAPGFKKIIIKPALVGDLKGGQWHDSNFAILVATGSVMVVN